MPEAYDPVEHGARCSSCPLNGQPVVPPTIPAGRIRLAIVGEGPGKIEIREKRGFVGPSGRLLDSMLEEAGFDRREALVSNSVLCRIDDERDLPRASACCSMRLANELAALPPQVPTLALGASAAKATIGKGGILKARGFIWKVDAVKPAALKAAARTVDKRRATRKSAFNDERLARAESSYWLLQARAKLEGRIVIPSLHPAFLLRGADAWAPLLRVDVKRAVRYAEKPLKLEDDVAYVETSDINIVRRHLARLPKVVSLDVETDGPDPLHAKLDCIGVVGVDVDRGVLTGPALVMNPWRRAFGPLLNHALKERVVVGHNLLSFDITVCRRYGVHIEHAEDTLLAHHAFASHVRQGLDHVTSVFCDAAPWKVIHKSRGNDEKGQGFAVKDLARYNASDVGLTALDWVRMQADLAPERSVYEADKKLAALCCKMQRRGIRVDVAKRDFLARKLRARAAGLKGEMRKLLRKPSFQPSKTADIRAALFERFKAPLFALTPTGLPSTAAGTLEALQKTESRAGQLADLIIRWRSALKTVSTFLEGIDIARDGHIHASWRAFGTVTGRLSSQGPNCQNYPRRVLRADLKRASKERIKELGDEAYELDSRVREIYIAAPGHVWVYFDLAQSEARAAAYLSGDDAFIQVCESGDVHAGNAAILFPDAAELLRTDPKGKGKIYRDVAKNALFAILYRADVSTVLAYLLSQGFEVSLGDVEAMFDVVRQTYARYNAYCDENLELCRRQGHLRTALAGRVRRMSYFPKPTETANFVVQSCIADLMNERLLAIDTKLPRGAHIIAQIHDAAIIEVPAQDAQAVSDIVGEVWGRKIFVPTSGKEFVMPIDRKLGERWSDF